MPVFWRNWQAFSEDKLTSKEAEGGVPGLSALTRVFLAVELDWAVVESSLSIPAMTRFRGLSSRRNWS